MASSNINLKHVLIGDTVSGNIIYENNIVSEGSIVEDCNNTFGKFRASQSFGNNEVIPSFHGNIQVKLYQPSILVVVYSKSSYPQRLAFEMMDKINHEKYASMIDTNGRIDSKGKVGLAKTIEFYQRLENVDKISAINTDLEDVKLNMKTNIKDLAQNVESTERLAEKSKNIAEGANAFKNNASEIKKTTWWTNCKLIALITFVLVGIILAIILPIVFQEHKG